MTTDPRDPHQEAPVTPPEDPARPTTGPWQAVISQHGETLDGADPFADLDGHDEVDISIRRDSALPDDDGRLPGFYNSGDLIDVWDDLYVDEDDETTAARTRWEQAQAMTAGLHAAVPAWLIWSHKHNAWWGPNCAGYTSDTMAAGRYTLEKARKEAAFGWESDDQPAGVAVAAPTLDLIGTRELRQIMGRRIREATDAAVAARKTVGGAA
jgi:hypothetical protein